MTALDLRNTMDFFGMLNACARIRKLAPGKSLLIRSADRTVLADLRRIHPDCAFDVLSGALDIDSDKEYIFKATRTAPSADACRGMENGPAAGFAELSSPWGECECGPRRTDPI